MVCGEPGSNGSDVQMDATLMAKRQERENVTVHLLLITVLIVVVIHQSHKRVIPVQVRLA